MHVPLRFSLKTLLASIAAAAVLCAAVGWILNARAHDSWGYGKLAISNGTGQGPVYYVEVRGVGEQPTVVRMVRFANPADTPRNALEVSQRVVSELAAHVRNGNHWDKTITIIAGRANDERIELEIDAANARKLFTRPGTQLESFWFCDAFWDKYVAEHMPPDR